MIFTIGCILFIIGQIIARASQSWYTLRPDMQESIGLSIVGIGGLTMVASILLLAWEYMP